MRFKPKKVAIAAAILCLLMTTGFSPKPTARQETSAGPTIYLPIVMAPRAVDVLTNSTSFVDSTGYLHIAGEVANRSTMNLRNVEITANLFNSANQLLGTANGVTTLYTLPAGDRTCFELIVDPPAGWASYSFDPPAYTTDGYPLPRVTVIDQQGYYDPEFGWFDITGHVRNDTGRTVKFVSPVGTLYNSAGKVIACDFTYVKGIDMAPAQVSAFDLSFVRRDYNDIRFYRIQVDGEVQ